MKLTFAFATEADAATLAAVHTAAANELTRRFGEGNWSAPRTEKGVLLALRKPKFSKILLARSGKRIIGSLNLVTKKPWAIDTAYFTSVKTPLYLISMAVHPDFQRKGAGRQLMKEAERVARAWPADAIRLDAWDATAGAPGFYKKCGLTELAHVTYKSAPLVYFELLVPR